MELNALKRLFKGFPSGSEVKTPSANAGDSGLVPGSRRFPGEGNGNPLQYSYPENSMDRGLLANSTWGCRVQLSGGSVVKNLPSNIGDMGLIPGKEPGLLLS